MSGLSSFFSKRPNRLRTKNITNVHNYALIKVLRKIFTNSKKLKIDINFLNTFTNQFANEKKIEEQNSFVFYYFRNAKSVQVKMYLASKLFYMHTSTKQ